MADRLCTHCGHRNPPEGNFCSSCGRVLDVGASETTTTISLVATDVGDVEDDAQVVLPDLPEDAGMLVVKRGPNAGSRFVLDEDVVGAGRHPDSHIFLDDITVSRRHAEFVREGGGYVVRDVGSLNGTYLNRERIETSPLANGDEVQIGKFKLIFLARADG